MDTLNKIDGYLFPIVIAFFLFYFTACLIESTWNVAEMRVELKEVVFGIWICVSALFVFGKTLHSLPKNN